MPLEAENAEGTDGSPENGTSLRAAATASAPVSPLVGDRAVWPEVVRVSFTAPAADAAQQFEQYRRFSFRQQRAAGYAASDPGEAREIEPFAPSAAEERPSAPFASPDAEERPGAPFASPDTDVRFGRATAASAHPLGGLSTASPTPSPQGQAPVAADPVGAALMVLTHTNQQAMAQLVAQLSAAQLELQARSLPDAVAGSDGAMARLLRSQRTPPMAPPRVPPISGTGDIGWTTALIAAHDFMTDLRESPKEAIRRMSSLMDAPDQSAWWACQADPTQSLLETARCFIIVFEPDGVPL
ncbi:hypothetical protein T484DRAFT_1875787 [Baffinella frigidus]|nr:hypothetical protein T484DRAFT_1875787 [Cryptophyta sp. CCMP2293]